MVILFPGFIGVKLGLLLRILKMNTVRNLQIRPFHRLSRLSPDRPDLSSFKTSTSTTRLSPDRPDLSSFKTSTLTRRVTTAWYSRYSWLKGCIDSGKVYCFPCTLFGGELREKARAQLGVNDWKKSI